MRECARSRAPNVKNPLTAFQAALSLKNGYAPVMRRVLNIYPDQLKKIKQSMMACARSYAPGINAPLPSKLLYP